MDARIKAHRDASAELSLEEGASTVRLICGYTLLFAIFYVAIFSPFWFYGKAYLWSGDGMGQHLPLLTYSGTWIKDAVTSLLGGKPKLPAWSLQVGFGQNILGNAIGFRPSNALFALLPSSAMETFLLIRTVIRVYLSGMTFIIYARTQVKSISGLLLGALLYAFSGFTLIFAARHGHFMDLTIFLPLMLLCVDRIFRGRWSWLFIIIVAFEGLCNFYLLFLLTIPAVLYALFHFFELSPGERSKCGGFGWILLRHAVHYLLGLGLAAVSLWPTLIYAFESSRTAMQKGASLLFWDKSVYFNFISGLVDVKHVGLQGYVALSAPALMGILYLFYSRRKKDQLMLGQVVLYAIAFLVPVLTMLFSAFVGKTQRWCYIFSFWSSMASAYALPMIYREDGRFHRFCMYALFAYMLLYIAVCVYRSQEISIGVVWVLFEVVLICGVLPSGGGRRRKRRSTLLLFFLVLIELTLKSYTLYSPQYGKYINSYHGAGKVLEIAEDNAADALEMADDDGLYRTDVIVMPWSNKEKQINYGLRNGVNGVSSYFPYSQDRICRYSLDLGNSQQTSTFKIKDLDQRTVLDELAAVKYVATTEKGEARVPYGYTLVDSREKTFSDGTVTNESLYRNDYALPMSYAYATWIARQDYEALPIYRREQAMLQGVVLETEVPLEKAKLEFDDQVLLNHSDLMAAIKEEMQDNEKLEISSYGAIRVMEDGCSITLPVEKTKGEIYLLLEGASYESVNFSLEEARKLTKEGASLLEIRNAERKARIWQPEDDVAITASSGSLRGYGEMLGVEGQYYFGDRDLLLNLGYGSTGSKLKITFSREGEYRFDRIALIVQPMKDYAKKIAPLQARQALSTEIDCNRVTVKYDLDEAVLACLAIPYSKDWSATVDGEAVQIYPANGMYMGVMLTPGPHTIVFNYAMRGIVPGLAVSTATLLGLLIWAVVMLERRRRMRSERVK